MRRSYSNTLYGVVQVLFAPSSNGSTCVGKSVVSLCAIILQAFYCLVIDNILLQYADFGE